MKNISFVCPQCGSTIIADGSYCGQLIRCTSCNHRVLIPESAQPLPEEISADVEVSKNDGISSQMQWSNFVQSNEIFFKTLVGQNDVEIWR